MNQIIKCLSLWQPHASLVQLGEKKNETRSWKSTHRGLLAIHAAKATDTLALCREEPFRAVFAKHKIYSPSALPLGAILCLVKVEEIYPVEQLQSFLSAQEIAFGNYGPDRFAWKLKVVHVFETPLPCKGAQGIFALPPGLAARIQKEYTL